MLQERSTVLFRYCSLAWGQLNRKVWRCLQKNLGFVFKRMIPELTHRSHTRCGKMDSLGIHLSLTVILRYFTLDTSHGSLSEPGSGCSRAGPCLYVFDIWQEWMTALLRWRLQTQLLKSCSPLLWHSEELYAKDGHCYAHRSLAPKVLEIMSPHNDQTQLSLDWIIISPEYYRS